MFLKKLASIFQSASHMSKTKVLKMITIATLLSPCQASIFNSNVQYDYIDNIAKNGFVDYCPGEDTFISHNGNITDNTVELFCKKLEKSKNDYSNIKSIDLSDADRITGKSLDFLVECTKLVGVIKINLKGTKIQTKSSLEKILKSQYIGSQIEKKKVYYPLNNICLSQISVYVDSDCYDAIEKSLKKEPIKMKEYTRGYYVDISGDFLRDISDDDSDDDCKDDSDHDSNFGKNNFKDKISSIQSLYRFDFQLKVTHKEKKISSKGIKYINVLSV